jgi:hypothetical protein
MYQITENKRSAITILDIIRRPVFKTQLNYLGLFIPHMEQITSLLLWAQQVNDIYRFVTMVY